jgi:uncharacterized membrane protein YphA (DoxX/SURF4 family)
MKIAVIIVRTLIGLMFLFASITVLFHLIEAPPPPSEAVRAFNDGIAATGYFMIVLKMTELLCSLAFISGRFVPLATVVVAPIIVNIFLFHTFMDHSGLPIAIFLVAANLFLAYAYRKSYAPLFVARPAIN